MSNYKIQFKNEAIPAKKKQKYKLLKLNYSINFKNIVNK